MKYVKVKYLYNDAEVEGVLFERMSDIDLLRPELNRAENSVLVKFVKSNESDDRLNHIVSGFRPLEKAIANFAIFQGNLTETKSIYNLGIASDTYIRTLTKSLLHGAVFMNPSGGLCLVDGSLEILESHDFVEFPNPPKYYIWKDSKVINLENDFELENDAVTYMNKRFNNKYSSIKDMKTYSDRDFKRVFTKFVEQGGEYVYVYTTGMDYEQMYQYSTNAIQCGLTKFIFQFNSGMDKNITTFIDWLKERAEVELI